jgi:arylsulfatase A-like enzyme
VTHYREKLGPEEPFAGEGYFPNQTPRATYAAMISTLDEQVGQIMDELDTLGLRERTVVMFSSDNGPVWVDLAWDGTESTFFDSARPFRSDRGRGKGSVFEGGIRVPMIAAWPGHIAPGTTTDHVSAFWDVLPTLAEIARAPAPTDVDGISFAPLLLGREEAQARHEFLYWEFPSYGGQQAVRLGRWKGIRREMFDGSTKIELFDLESDLEENDVSAAHPEIVARIAAIMEREHTPSEIPRFRFEVLGER